MFRYRPSGEQLASAEQMIVDRVTEIMLQQQRTTDIIYDYYTSDIKVNMAVGPDCPTRCEGCYNFFADTATSDRALVTASEMTDFVGTAKEIGINRVTLYGGDPLHHPEIIEIVQGLGELGVRVKMDTVGTAFIKPVRAIYKGRGIRPQIPIESIKEYVDLISIPLDGSIGSILQRFRKGRPDLFGEILLVGATLKNAGVRFGVNTVANAANINDLGNIKDIAEEMGAAQLQVFEFDYEGPNPTTRRDELRLAPGRFAVAAAALKATEKLYMPIICKPFEGRAGSYFMIDDAGTAYTRIEGGGRKVIGHIIRDQDVVLRALHKHNEIRRGYHRVKGADEALASYLFALSVNPRIAQALRTSARGGAQAREYDFSS